MVFASGIVGEWLACLCGCCPQYYLLLVSPCGGWGWVWNLGGGRVGGVVGFGTLLGPEGSRVAPVGVGVGGVALVPGLMPRRLVVCVGGPGCCLRTAQWTRASL